MHINFKGLVFISLISALSACDSPKQDHHEHHQVDLEALKEQIQKQENRLAEAHNTKNVEELLDIYGDEIITYGPLSEPIIGKEAKRNHFNETAMLDTTNTTVRYDVIEVFGEGNMAVETGNWFAYDEAGWEKDKGIYMALFKKVDDDDYLCIREIWNSTMPKKVEKSTEESTPTE